MLVFARNAPRLFMIMNESVDKSEFSYLLTVINLSSDTQNNVQFHFPPEWRKMKEILILNGDGEWIAAKHTRNSDGVILHEEFQYMDVTCLMIK